MVQILYAKIQDIPEAVKVSADPTTVVGAPTTAYTSMEDPYPTDTTAVTAAAALLAARAEHTADAPPSVY